MPLGAIIALAIAAVLVLAFVLVWTLGARPGARLAPLRASAIEASERTTDLAAEFFEWLRRGR
jgi:hypothetical protein